MGEAEAAVHLMAAVEAILWASEESDAAGTFGGEGVEIGHKWPWSLVECRGFSHAQGRPEVILR